MGSLGPFKNFLPEDYPKSPDWFTKFLANLNQFTLSVYNNLNGDLNVFTNLAEARFVLSITAGADALTWTGPTSFKNPLGNAQISDLWITKVQIMGVKVYTPVTTNIGPIDWSCSGSSIILNSIPGLIAGVQYAITLRFAL